MKAPQGPQYYCGTCETWRDRAEIRQVIREECCLEACRACGHTVTYGHAPGLIRLEWSARWSGGMCEAGVLLRGSNIFPQREFARHIRHVLGGSELYRFELEPGDRVIFLYRSGSGRTATATVLPSGPSFDSWDEAEQSLGLPEGSLAAAFIG